MLTVTRNGDSLYVSWTAGGFLSSTIGNFYLTGNGFSVLVAANKLLSTGSFSFAIGSTISPNYGYVITAYVGSSQFSSTPFVVSPASI